MTSRIPKFEIIRGETDLFSHPKYDLSIESTIVQDVYPQTSTSDRQAPLVFFIQGNDTCYINTRESLLYLRCKVTDSDGTALPAITDANVLNYGTTNNILNSIFERVHCYIQEVEITSKTNNLQPYRSYFENVLSYSQSYKKSQLEAAGYFHQDDATSKTDTGWQNRSKLISQSRDFELIGVINSDLWKFDRLILPGLDIRIVLHRSPDAFVLECTGTGKKDINLEILEAKLKVMKHTLLPSIALAHLQTWQQHPAIYPYNQSQLKTYSIPTGTTQVDNSSVLNGLLPNRMVLALIESSKIAGDYTKNALLFTDQHLTKVQVTVNSEKGLEQSIDCDVASKRYLEAYYSIFSGLGCNQEDPTIDITLKEYLKGKTLFIFDLTHSLNDDNFSMPKHGTVNIHLRFKTATTKSVTVLLYLEYPAILNIYNDKTVEFQELN